jgi:hypothetical protein
VTTREFRDKMASALPGGLDWFNTMILILMVLCLITFLAATASGILQATGVM